MCVSAVFSPAFLQGRACEEPAMAQIERDEENGKKQGDRLASTARRFPNQPVQAMLSVLFSSNQFK